MHRLAWLTVTILACISLSLKFASANDEVTYSHADLAHAPVQDHELHSFVPHAEMQAPGSVIHHVPNAEHHPDQPYHYHEDQQQHYEQQPHNEHQQAQHHYESQQHAPLDHQQFTTDNPTPLTEHQAPQYTASSHVETHENVMFAKAPERSKLIISCPPEHGLIHILDSSFGQGQGAFDFDTGVIHKGFCHTPLDINNSGCLRASHCEIPVTQQSAHGYDPCIGVFKRAVVTYKCTHDPIPSQIHPIDVNLSPAIQLHEFLPPPSVALGGINHENFAPGKDEFFRHFFVNQQKTTFPFPEGEECEADAHRLCGGLLKNCLGEFHCVTQCITDHAPHLSPACLQRHPCFADIEEFCPHVQGGDQGIMNCLKENAAHLSHQCTSLHPCLLDSSCHAIDYDDRVLQPSVPIVKNIPEYMQHLREARMASPDSGAKVGIPFSHLVLPTLVRTGDSHPVLGGEVGPLAHEAHPDSSQIHLDHLPVVPEPDQSFKQHLTPDVQHGANVHQPVDYGFGTEGRHAQEQQYHHEEQQPQHSDYQQHQQDHSYLQEHEQPPHQGHVQEYHPTEAGDEHHAATSYAPEGVDEDVENEHDASFDPRTLGTGHFSHIYLQAFPDHAIDVYTQGLKPEEGFEVALWELRHVRNQLFDYNHFGQIFWIHTGEDHAHYCLTAHPHRPQEIVSELCIHTSPDGGVTLHEDGHSQVWHFSGTQIHHISTGKCLEVQGIAHGVGKGNALRLEDCATHQTAQQWVWESGSLAEHNEHIFDEHHAAVMARLAQEQHQPLAQEHQEYIHDQTQAAHDAAYRAQQDHVAMEQIRSELDHTRAQDHAEHEQFLHAQQQHEAQEEAQLHHLEEEVAEVAAKEHQDHLEIEQERHELQQERDALHHEEEVVHEEEARLDHLEKEYRDHSHGTQEHDEELHSNSAHEPIQVPSEEPVHFFTPITLILSVLFIAVLAYVFRVYLFPRVCRRWSEQQKPSHYYSHAY